MKKDFKHIILSLILFFSVGFYTLKSDATILVASPGKTEQAAVQQDTVPETRYPVSKIKPEEYDDLNKQSPADLRDPENIQTTIDYDLQTGMYIIRTRIGDMELGTPMSLTPEEYQDYSLQESMRAYYRQKNEENFLQETQGGFNIADMQFNIGAADKLFGPGGVRIRSQGSAEIALGLKRTTTKNPSLPESARNRTFFNFDNNVQLNMQAYVGTKVNFNLNYNTQSSFDFDANRLKLAYTGEEDEIIKTLEAGNVSLNTSNSLIRGGAALFGIKTELQFGKLRVNALLAQQNSESQTVSTKGGAQTRDFEISVDQYEEDRHFFLAYYFREQYDKSLAKLPYISSGVKISKIEVWVTNTRRVYNQARNIVAYNDLGEHDDLHINNPEVVPTGSLSIPYNYANNLYQTLIDNYPDARNNSLVGQTLDSFLEKGTEYEKVESARMLERSEYIVNEQLGYISLSAKLQPGDVLAVAYKYTYGGQEYQVGEFANDDTENTSQCLYLKLLKGVSMTPAKPYWDLMMKNIYSLGAYSVSKDRFRLNILYQSDTTGTYINYLPEGNIANKLLLQVMNLDRLDANDEPYPNGIFDFVDGYTITSANGRIIFPVVEPFGSHLSSAIGNASIANRYVYQELYDSTKTVAQQIAEKNKFVLRGEYRASSGSEIVLGATNVARGSVVVTAGGTTLTENVDYTVDYISGIVTLINESIIASNTPVSISMENQSTFNMQRKTMMGLDLNYEFSKNLTVGATIMHLSEMPLTTKTTMGDESIKNTLWGANIAYQGESQWLTNLVDKIPLVNLTKPSQISFNGEFAHLIAGHYESDYSGAYSYLDDFESTQSNFDLINPYPWALASVPVGRFPEGKLTNDINYGKNRSLLAWYYIDGIFARKSRSLPDYLRKDDVISQPYVRPVKYDELFPGKDQTYNENSQLSVLNLAYYPTERGPYNLDAENINPDGTLSNPEKRWGGIMRKIDQSDFELANIEYIEFWLMDPFIENSETASGGYLYFNLGDISEDVLKDEKKFFENGLPINEDMSQVEITKWGKVPIQQSTVDGFDNTSGARERQDVGLNGLSSEEEKTFPAYQTYLEQLKNKLSPALWEEMGSDPDNKHTPRTDPAGDNFTHFRNSYYDRTEADILTRYKYYNGTEGNSVSSEDNSSAKTTPDVEDINQDNTLNDSENYFEYEVALNPKNMEIGSNFIVNKRAKEVKLANGTRTTTTWYQFKIPIKDKSAYQTVGSIQDFKTIRFMRMYMTGFNETTILRFGTFALVRGEWRTYTQDLSGPNSVASNGTLDITSVNIEEDGDREPVNYVLPPGVSRLPDPSQSQIIQQNEQALSLKVTNLGSQDARAIYKTTSYDLRKYKRMQLFVHAERLVDNLTNLQDGEFSVFLRLGSDYKNNYYEYEVPLKLTPEGVYSDDSQREIVWPESNMLDFKMSILTDLKTKRNKARRAGESGVSYNAVYSEYDPDPEKQQNTISVIGNPSLAEVKTIMIGIRNKTSDLKSGEIWVNELRMTDFDEDGGWAANGNLNVALSDLGTFNASGRIETAGFGGLDQSLSERSMDDYKQYAISTSVQLGKFFPEKARVNLPIYYAYSKETTSPKYNPLDQDILLQDELDAATTKAEKDSIKSFSQDQTTTKSLSINNVSVGIRSKNPMPYDPANFSFSYASSENKRTNPETEYETTKNHQGGITYNYTPYAKPLTPFRKLEKNNGYTRYIKQLSFNYLPSSLNFQTTMTRNYYETQLRDLSNLNAGASNPIGVSFSEAFYWDRSFGIRWSPLSNLNLEFSSNTNARIEAPHVQVNKKLEPDSFKVWKDDVLKSIRDLGTPLAYDQVVNITYNLPLQYVPVLEWINASGTYNATYNWERGSYIDNDVELGNTITNQRQINMQGSMNFQLLYNKNEFLRKVNQKFGSGSAEANRKAKENAKKRKNLKYQETIELSPDSGVIVTHGLVSKKLRITARFDSDSTKSYRVDFKVLDLARIRILNHDSVKIKLTIYPAPPPEENFWYKAAEYSSRFLMMVRRVNIQYSMSDGMMIPGFQPMIGDWIGQADTDFGSAPGWGFALGDVRESYITDAKDRGWLITNNGNSDSENNYVNPAMINSSKTFTATATLEPAAGLKIDLNATRVDSRDTEIEFMFPNMPTQYGGTFTMTTAAIGSVFSGIGSAKNGYSSKTFDKFLANTGIIAARLQSSYDNINYSGGGNIQQVSANSSDVLIPAFLAAYTGKDAGKIKTTAFPAITSLIPNWKITYDGLIKLPFISKHFKSMILNHQYRCTYSVGGYSSNLSWESLGQGKDMGVIPSNSDPNSLQPSSIYEISSVNITESLSPIIGVDATFLNNVTTGAKIQKTRNLNLNMSSFQLIETHSNEVVVSVGYKYADFNKVLKMKKKGDFNHDLTLRLDYSRRKNQSLIRKIEDGYTQMTQGAIVKGFQFSADYAFSKAVTLRAFYDLQINEPLMSSASYPTSNSNYGISMRLSLTQ
ncbi:MAG: cell surface protein SprA [Tannerella sp.]|jgi:cell surface protein SprA|nr:cell surface protein SprA [Tannerella sp.]